MGPASPAAPSPLRCASSCRAAARRGACGSRVRATNPPIYKLTPRLGGRPPLSRRRLTCLWAPAPARLRAVRYPGGPSTRHSRGSVRASVRQPGHSSTLSGLGGADRMQVLDEEGRDRTPRPLLASRPALHPTAGSESIGSWASDSLPDSSGPASERSSVHAQQFGALASLATFGLSDVPSEPLPPDAPAAAGPQVRAG